MQKIPISLLSAISIVLIQFIALQSFAQLTEKNYKIYSVSQSKEVSVEEIADAMEDYDVLFYGEEHNDSVTHYLENKIFETLFSKYGNHVALSLEMFDRDVQTVMNEYLDGHIREKNFKKDARVWSNYADYRPMVEFAKKNMLDVVCANAPSRYTNLAGRKGQEALEDMSYEAKNYFAPLPYDTATDGYYEKLMGLSSHDPAPAKDTVAKKAPLPAMAMGGFNLIVAQSLWDATMAYSIYEYLAMNRKQKVMQVNGRFHSDEKFAIVTQLQNYRPRTRMLVISSGTDEAFPNINWDNHKHLGDYIIITDPKVPRTYKD